MAFDPAPSRREPIINAPAVVVATAGALVGLHAAVEFLAPDRLQIQIDWALFPIRFFASPGSEFAYPDEITRWLTLLSTAFLHGNWMHVLVNSLMLLAFGAPVARTLGAGQDLAGSARWMLVFVVSVVAGSGLYLALQGAGGPPAVGASGGTSGLMAAAFMIDRFGRLRQPWSREFLGVAVVFAALNALLVFMGPQLFGGGIAWEAHAGGFIGGAAIMYLLGRTRLRAV